MCRSADSHPRCESEAQPGQDVQLTIDSRIQFVAEQELAKMVALHHAKSGSLVAMDPRTGDILAHGERADLRSQ